MSLKKPKVREEPRLSVNKLGEYMVAKPLRRKRILLDAKYPPVFMTKRYEEACETIVAYFTNGRDMNVVARKIEEVAKRRGETTFEVETNLNVIQALKQFYDNGDNMSLPDDFEAISGLGGNLPPLAIAGTAVSIRPEVLIHHELKGKPVTGAIKLYFSKTHPLEAESADYVGALVRHQMQEVYDRIKVNPKCCYVYDVFQSKQYQAPNAYKQKFNNVEAACAEIADRWNSIVK